jgi:hypothetical protein
MFDGSLPETGDLAALDDAALVDAAAGWSRTENAACARKVAVMAELFARRTGLPAGEREDWWVDPEAAVGGAGCDPEHQHLDGAGPSPSRDRAGRSAAEGRRTV